MTGRYCANLPTGDLRRSQRGMALVIVLWMVVLLGVIATSHARNARSQTLLAAHHRDMAEMRAAAEAGINITVLEMISGTRQSPEPDGTAFSFEFESQEIVVAVRKASGLVDLNRAPEELLMAPLRICRLDEVRSKDIASAILDWRDDDQQTRIGGAEDPEYEAAGYPWTAKDDRFDSLDELRYIPGVNQADFECLQSLITIHSGSSTVDLEYAPPALVEQLAGQTLGFDAAANNAAASRRGSTYPSGNYHVYAQATAPSGVIATLEVVVRLSNSRTSPYRILDWRETARARSQRNLEKES